jgi:hypothetical protein
MREHPIPQDVVGYRFHIIGNMTLKQFAEIGAGCVVGFLIYTTNLTAFIKWPFIGLAVAAGAMAAFVPFEERPLDHWIATFFKVLYKPTKFFWKREPHIPDAFLYKPNADQSVLTSELDLSPYRRQRIKDYLTSVQNPIPLDPFESAEEVHMQSIMSAFNTIRVEETGGEKVAHRPSLKVRVRQFKGSATPLFTVDAQSSAQPEAELQAEVQLQQRQALAATQVAQEIEIPELEEVSIEPSIAPEAEATQALNTADDRAYLTPDQVFETTQVAETMLAEDATLNLDLPFPDPPTIPNKLVGMILSPANDLINDAIVEIQTVDGRVARAVKSNALGQFFVATPLENGDYTLLVEKDGFAFNPLQISLNGKAVPPIEIRSV